MARIQLSGTQIPTLSKLNVDGEFTLDAASGTTGQILISQGAGNTPVWTSSLNLLEPLLTPLSTVGGGGSEGGQISFARVTDGNQYWYIDSYGSTSAPSLRFVENTTVQVQIDTGGIVNLYGSLKPRAGTATANTAPIYLATGTNLTTPVSGAVEYDGTVLYATSKTDPGRALLTQNYYYLSNSSIGIDMSSAALPLSLLATTTTGITVPAGTTYDYEAMFAIQGTFILTSQTPTITISSLSGTATVAHTTIIETGNNTTGFTTASTLGATRITAGQALTALTAGSRYYIVKMRGTIRVTGSGTAEIAPTIRPNVGSVDNGWTVQPGAMFKLTPIGNGTVTTVGTWA